MNPHTIDNPHSQNLRARLMQKLEQLSTEQLNSLWQFVEALEEQASLGNSPTTDEEIDLIVESYRQQNKLLPIGLAKGELVIPDAFNEPLPDEILDLFEQK